jgi:hypothetical protein
MVYVVRQRTPIVSAVNWDLLNSHASVAVRSIHIGAKVLDPCMRRSTEFPQWVKDHHDELKDKKVLMYCTAGVRCERASSFLKHQGIDNVFQLDGGIHR